MGTLLLIRHGRSTANAEGLLAGRLPGISLDEVGISSTEVLRSRLANVPIVQAVVSPLERTRETAERIFTEQVPVAFEDRLLECDYGDWQGLKLAEISTHELWPIVRDRPDEMIFPNGESMTEMSNRAVSAMRQWDEIISNEHGPGSIWAAVSHGDIIKAICADALGLPLRKFQSLMIEPASVSVVHYGEHGSSVSKLNETGESWLNKLTEAVPTAATVGGETGKDETK
jgi:probable phosphomutase (TIGR03848 family)